MSNTVRPTKKQRDLLTYIESFISEHGYSPSYREIMNGLDYNSVATVALHVNSLISRGHLRKRDRSARSLEVVNPSQSGQITKSPVADTAPTQQPAETAWLVGRVGEIFAAAGQHTPLAAETVLELSVLVSALRLLGLPEAAANFEGQLSGLKAA